MGFFAKKPQHPDLAEGSMAAERLAAIRSNLEKLAQDVRDPMEVVPTDDGAYVFIGKPPKKFGVAWIEDGEIKSFNTLMQEHGMSSQDVVKISDKLRDIYVRHHDCEHFRTKIADREIVVTPSEPMESEVRDVLTNLH